MSKNNLHWSQAIYKVWLIITGEEKQGNHCHVLPSKLDVKENWMHKSVKRVLNTKTSAVTNLWTLGFSISWRSGSFQLEGDPRQICSLHLTHLALGNYLRNLHCWYNNRSLLKVGGSNFQRECKHLIFELLGFFLHWLQSKLKMAELQALLSYSDVWIYIKGSGTLCQIKSLKW